MQPNRTHNRMRGRCTGWQFVRTRCPRANSVQGHLRRVWVLLRLAYAHPPPSPQDTQGRAQIEVTSRAKGSHKILRCEEGSLCAWGGGTEAKAWRSGGKGIEALFLLREKAHTKIPVRNPESVFRRFAELGFSNIRLEVF